MIPLKKGKRAGMLSQAETIKQYMLQGKTITTMQAYELFGITCLAQRVSDLRHKQGVDVEAKFIEKNGKRFVEYSMNNCTNDADKTPLNFYE